MKQKSKKPNDVITKNFLRKEFQQFGKLFNKKLSGFEKALGIKSGIKFDSFARGIDENARKYRDQILNSNDKLAKELEEIREDKIIGSSQMTSLKDQVDSHEKKSKRIERIQQAV